jgi:hypothetical protein
MSGPGTFLTAASVLGAHALCDGLGEVPALPQELIDFMREQLGQYFDMPQMGSVAVAIGSYLLATRRRMVSHICARVRGSSPVVGSSRNSSGGVAIKPAARSRRRRMPPEKFSRALFAASVSPAAPPGSRRRRPAAPRRP